MKPMMLILNIPHLKQDLTPDNADIRDLLLQSTNSTLGHV